VWFVNLFAGSLLTLLRVSRAPAPSSRGYRTRNCARWCWRVAISSPRSIAASCFNLFDLERLTVDDVMTRAADRSPRHRPGNGRDPRQLTTTYHNKLPVYEEDITRVAGILHIRKLLPLLAAAS